MPESKDALATLLAEKYEIPPDELESFRAAILRDDPGVTGGRYIQEEALTNVANTERSRIDDLNYLVALAAPSPYPAHSKLAPGPQAKLDSMLAKSRESTREESKKLKAEKEALAIDAVDSERYRLGNMRSYIEGITPIESDENNDYWHAQRKSDNNFRTVELAEPGTILHQPKAEQPAAPAAEDPYSARITRAMAARRAMLGY